MILKYLGTVLSASDSENRVVAVAWSPNNLKLAVALSDRAIYLFDENGNRKDRFSTKPVDSKVIIITTLTNKFSNSFINKLIITKEDHLLCEMCFSTKSYFLCL